MEHHFDINVAKKYGVNQAIILNHLQFWIEKNQANEKHFYDGYYWTYSSTKALTKIFPYFTEKQIKYSLSKLVDFGLIIKGNYNKSPYDKTNWFAITNEGFSILQNCPIEGKTAVSSNVQNCPIEEKKLSNRREKIVQPIPDIKTYNKIDNLLKEKYKKENFESDTITTNFQNLPFKEKYKKENSKSIIPPPKEGNNTGKVAKEELTKIEKLDKKTKHKYGEYQNVLLTDEELEKLKTEFPNDFEIRIEQLSEYIEIKAPKYKNHLAVIRAWARKDAEKIKAIEANYSFSVEKYENDEPDFDALNRMLEKQPKRRT